MLTSTRTSGGRGDDQEMQPPFICADGTVLVLEAVVRLLEKIIAEQPDRQYRLIIGTDSLPGRLRNVQFITAIVLHRVGAGGRYFWCQNLVGPIVTLRDRMLQETLLSLQIAQVISTVPGFQTLAALTELEIHVDIGQGGPTREMIQEIVGMVTAHGYNVRIKPDAFAASKVADRHTVVWLD